MERQVVGEGAYGCVHRPALRCEKDRDLTGKTVDYTHTLSKLTEVRDMVKEMKEYKTIEKIDKQGRFYTGTPVTCIPQKDDEFYRAVNKCSVKGHEYRTGDVGLIVMKDGGEDLGKFASSLDSTDPNSRRILNAFWWEMIRILEGIRLFLKKAVIHFDLKEGNIVYDVIQQRANFIDFGTLVEKKHVMDEAKTGDCSRCIRHWSYPFETYYLRKDVFEKEYKTENARLFYPLLHDVFSTVPSAIQEPAQKKHLLNLLDNADDIPLNELNPNSDIVVLYGELKTPHLPHLLTDYLKAVRPFLEQYKEWTYDAFVEKSLNTTDIYGVGIAFMYVLKHAQPFMSPAFFDEMYRLTFRMMTPDLKERYDIDPLLKDYKKLLKKHIPEFAPPKQTVVLSKRVASLKKRMRDDSKSRHSATGSFIQNNTKKCSEEKIINPKTGRCIKNKTRKSSIRRTVVLPRSASA